MKTNLNDYIVNISNTSYKFTKNTILRADKAIGHIKKNKKVYKYTVAFLALCLAPEFIELGKVIIYEFITALANQPSDVALKWTFEVTLHFAKYLCMFLALYNLVKINMIDLINDLKSKYCN